MSELVCTGRCTSDTEDIVQRHRKGRHQQSRQHPALHGGGYARSVRNRVNFVHRMIKILGIKAIFGKEQIAFVKFILESNMEQKDRACYNNVHVKVTKCCITCEITRRLSSRVQTSHQPSTSIMAGSWTRR